MMPSPPAGASHGDEGSTERVTVAHLVCGCQRSDPRLALCGTDVTDTHAGTLLLPAPAVQSCAVCLDLGRTVLIARRCERCPT
jgi:hypothetical protein